MTDDRMKGSSINKIRFLKLDYHSGYSQEMHLQAWKCQKVKACCAKNYIKISILFLPTTLQSFHRQ